MKARAFGWITAGLLVLCGSTQAADVKQPAGYGKVRFGATVDEVKKAYPKLEELNMSQSLGAPVIKGPDITRYVLHAESYPGVAEPIDVELRFWKGKLWLYIAYFPPAQSDSVLAKLVADHGPSTGKNPDYPNWKLEKSTVLLEKKLGRVTVNDDASTKEAQAWFLAELKKGMAARKPPAAAPGQAAPAAAPALTPAAH